MLSLRGTHIRLRALEPTDLEFLYELENNPAIWEVSGTTSPYSRHMLQQYLDNAHRDIYEVKQLRLAIANAGNKVVGFADLFEFDPKHRRAGIGLVILKEDDRNRGMGAETVGILCNYAFSVLELHQVYAHVLEDNIPSIRLFRKLGFEQTGLKKDWCLSGGTFKSELLFQKIKG